LEEADMDRWEYTIADLTEVKKNIEELNRLGAEGPGSRRHGVDLGPGGFTFVHPIALLKRRLTTS
jgi:hypothetical protein